MTSFLESAVALIEEGALGALTEKAAGFVNTSAVPAPARSKGKAVSADASTRSRPAAESLSAQGTTTKNSSSSVQAEASSPSTPGAPGAAGHPASDGPSDAPAAVYASASAARPAATASAASVSAPAVPSASVAARPAANSAPAPAPAAPHASPIARMLAAIKTADAVVVGAGAGMSTSAGFAYGGERFARWFGDFEERYGFHDMYAGSFYPFPTPEEYWAFWSRVVYCNRYDQPAGRPYELLLDLLRGKDCFVITTNVDHRFQAAGFDKRRLFYMQGDYGLFQCSEPCRQETFDNEKAVRAMLEQQHDLRIPGELVPHCPRCGKPMKVSLRCDSTFVQDAGWHAAAERCRSFLDRCEGRRTVYLELGVGSSTPSIIKFPFWQMTAENPQATYVCVNKGEAFAPHGIEERSIVVDGDIAEMLDRAISLRDAG